MNGGSPFRFPRWWNVCNWGTAAAKFRLILVLIFALLAPKFAHSQTEKFDTNHPPTFEDYPATEVWNGTPAALKLTTRSERMFRTKLTDAVKEPPNFAGHYGITHWGCGSVCSAGAVVDLQTGDVFPPALAKPNGSGWERWIECAGCFEGTGEDVRLDSRLVIVRCGLNYSERLQRNVPDVYYFVWEGDRFRQILFISGKQTQSLK